MTEIASPQPPASPDDGRAGNLIAVVRRLAAARSLDQVMQIVTRAARGLLSADGVTFVLRDGEFCFYAEEDSIAPLWKGRRFPLSACISGWCMVHDRSAVIPDIYADPRIPADAYRPTFVQSLAMVPVRQHEPIAAMGAYWSSRHEASPADLELLQAIADAAGLAVAFTRMVPRGEESLAAELADTRYRAIFNQAAVGVARVAPTGRFIEVNDRFCEITGYEREPLLALTFQAITHPDDLAGDETFVAALLAGERDTYAMEKRYLRRDGTVVWVNLTVSLVCKLDGGPDYFISVVEDITARKRAAAAEQARAEEFHALADNIPTLCWMAFADGHIYWFNRRWYEYTGASPHSQEGWGWEGVHDPEVLPLVLERWQRSLTTGEPFEMSFPLRRHDGEFRMFLTRIVPIRGEDGRISRWFGSNTDIAEQQEHEDRLKLLINELNHRVKNTLATVQSIAAQTLRAASDPNVAYRALEGRLLGLSGAHNILTARNWEGASLGEIAERTISPFAAGKPERVRSEGPEVWLPPNMAVPLALAFHELATNAVKYGSLSNGAGRVELSWALRDDGAGAMITWTETGGPPVVCPARRGFGSRLIERSLAGTLGGPAALDFQPTGVVCRIGVDLAARPRAAE